MNDKTILIPQLEGLKNVAVTISDPKGQNKGNRREKLEQKGYIVTNKNY